MDGHDHLAELAASASASRLNAEQFQTVADAIDLLVEDADAGLSLDGLAASCGMSAGHFQRLFKAGAGVSPKRFLQFLAAGKARRAMARGQSVMAAAFEAGLSGPSRLHDLLLVADAMTPGAYKKKGQGLVIRYGLAPGPLGVVLIGATELGVCWLSFVGAGGPQTIETKTAEIESGGVAAGIDEMVAEWPAARFVEDVDYIGPLAEQAFAFASNLKADTPLRLHVTGTNFQLKVWEALLRIPHGETVSYGDVAHAIGAPKAARAVGTAIGANKIALLIPCHRVIRASGAIDGYRWGSARKGAALAMEAARVDEAASVG